MQEYGVIGSKKYDMQKNLIYEMLENGDEVFMHYFNNKLVRKEIVSTTRVTYTYADDGSVTITTTYPNQSKYTIIKDKDGCMITDY